MEIIVKQNRETVKQKMSDILLDVSWAKISERYFEKSRSWLYHKMDGMNNGKPDASIGLDILMAAKYFERIGDHAVNIAEWVEYSITGNHRSGSSHTDNYFVEE